MTKKILKWLLVVIKVVVTIAFISVVNKTLFSSDTDILGLIPIDLLLWSSALSLISVVVQGYRWHTFLRIFGIEVSFGEAMKSYVEGLLFAVVTPGRVGELFRGYTLDEEWRKRTAVVVVTERIWSTAIIFLVGFSAFFFLPPMTSDLYKWGLFASSLLSMVALVIIPIIVKRKFPSLARVKRRFLKSTLLTIWIQIILVIQAMGLLTGRVPLTLSQMATASSSAFTAMQFMPVTIANMGVREFNITTFVSLYIPDSISTSSYSAVILSVSLIIMISNLLLPALPGLLFLIFSRITGKSVRK